MTQPADPRRQLGAFLRARREAVTPAQAGLPSGGYGRRRTPGLRREEVAQLCGISTTWYTWTEQGRDITLSASALARLADALRLTVAERRYLFELARRRDPAPPPASSAPTVVPPTLKAILEATAAPAYLLDGLWHARAWNAAAADLFAPWFDGGDTSLLRFVFLNPVARDFISDWDDRARRLLAEFRADIARTPDDQDIQRMVTDLQRDSPAFAAFWNSHAVLGRGGGARRFSHPIHGAVRYDQMTLVPSAFPDHKIVILLPAM
jgi:transcriptional regulator with XRE-family HTH domain